MSKYNTDGRERLEVVAILITEVEVTLVQGVLLKADAKSVQNEVFVGDRDLVRLELVANGLLDVPLLFHFAL